ncbi:MAG TPA: hypothetical protein VN673_06925, partial [Clostridia bacterium]|nr:hypothetical protein [Clostridia bacterium]
VRATRSAGCLFLGCFCKPWSKAKNSSFLPAARPPIFHKLPTDSATEPKKYYPWFGVLLSSLYLLVGLYSYACFGITSQQKSEIVTRMENSESVREACNIGRPFISATFSTMQLGARFLALSLFVTSGNLLLFLLIRMEGRRKRLVCRLNTDAGNPAEPND